MKEVHNIGKDDVEVLRYGSTNADAKTVVYQHGMPSSAEEIRLLIPEHLAVENNLNVIAITNPHYGNSVSKQHRSVDEITDRTLGLLDSLGVSKFYSVGTSMGAQRAISLADKAGDRATGVAVISGLPSRPQRRTEMPLVSRIGFTLAENLPELVQPFISWLAGKLLTQNARRNPYQEFLNYKNILPKRDQDRLANPEVAKNFVTIIEDWSRQGTGEGFYGDLQRGSALWNKKLKEFAKHALIIHGTHDPVVPAEAAVKEFEKIPDHTTVMIEGGGHAIYADPETTDHLIKDILKRSS